MTLRTKALLIISVTLAGLIVALYAASRVVLLGSFAELEQREAQRNVERVLSAVTDDLSGLGRACRNAALWDEAYAFIRNASPDFVKSQIGRGAFSDLAVRRLNVEVYVRSSGEIVFGESFDLANQKEGPLPEGLRNHIFAGSRLLEEGGASGILLLPQGPMLVASKPVLTSAGQGPVRGYLVMGRYLNSAEARRLGERTHLSVSLLRVNDSRLPPGLLTPMPPASGRTPIPVRPLNAETVVGYALLRDIYGAPVLALRVDMPREIYKRGLTTVLCFLVSLAVVGLVFGVVTLVLLERAILSRLTRLGTDVARIGESGDHSARVSRRGADELSSLAGAINRMLEALERSQQEIVHRQRAQEEALAARQLAEESSRAKSAFLANMSHELRTPLNAVIGYSEMLREDAEDKQEERAATDLARITASGKHLLALIDDVLDLAKVEAGRTELLWEKVSPAQILEDAAGTMAALAQKNGNRLLVHCAPDLPAMYVDVMKFRQSLYNLLGNACKFTRNGTIRVDVAPATMDGVQSIEWRVSDTGIGIAPHQMHRLFQPFSQVDASTTRQYGGTGLGLAISQRFCQLMGGAITVSSEPGKGSTFTIRLPRRAELPQPAEQLAIAVEPKTDTVVESEQPIQLVA